MENSVRYSSGSGFCRFFRAGLDEEDIMTSKEIRIGLSSGLEARPAAMLVQVASQYESSIYVESEEKRVNAKSIMGMMTLDLPVGEQVVVTADGVDEEKAVNDIEKYLSNNKEISQDMRRFAPESVLQARLHKRFLVRGCIRTTSGLLIRL